MSTTETKPYPLDFDDLSEGSYIDSERIEDIINEKKETTKYSQKACALGKTIERELSLRGKDVMVCMKNYGLLVMNSDQAVSYTRAKEEAKLKSFVNLHRRCLKAVNPGELDSETKQKYERDVFRRAFLITAIKKSRKITGKNKNQKQIE
jgi:hypothetical protein